jgi:hypothetical protein
MLINTSTQALVSELDFKNTFPNVCFPEVMDDTFLADYGYANLNYVSSPPNTTTQKYIESIPSLINGVWSTTWVATNFTPEELAAQLVNTKVDYAHQVQKSLDDFAATADFDGINSAAGYANSVLSDNPTSTEIAIKNKGIYANMVRLQTWAALSDLKAAVAAGTTPAPASIADVFAALPVLAWPA